ncbi:MAG: SpoIID/LytB domain-containing protein [Lachnospiraceae bacterium]|nr:SpoIID/LytB domain-containing protein [Lachnospiraceae bacterium]
MKTWVKTYLILAICMIGAGIIYLSLPLGHDSVQEQSEMSLLQGERERWQSAGKLEGTWLYRIEEGRIETSEGWIPLAEEVKWMAGGKERAGGKGGFLGQQIRYELNQEGKAVKIETAEELTTPARMRIVLSAAGSDYVHESVMISCEEAFWGIWDGEIRAYTPDSQIQVENIERRAVFYPAQEKANLVLTTEKGTVPYHGQLEVTREESGYIVINEVAVETYLMGVVPSEMPGSYGVEAAKVQAVCARSYAYSQWMASEKYIELGAQVDDSTQCQVYGGAVEYGASSEGVEATWGKVLTYEGQLISTNYFSTSCGYTANGTQVWGGAEERPYQRGMAQYTEGEYGDLSDEKNFHTFITDLEVKAFDSHSAWFRWNTSVERQWLQEQTDQFFSTEKMVKEVQGEQLIETSISGGIGELEDIFIYERANTGMACSLLLIGSEKSVVLEGPQLIRQFFGNTQVWLSNGESAGVRELLPSAFISLEKVKDTEENLVSVKICGGGYGHGVGMSQNGVKGMIDAGYTYEQILLHYYPETKLTDF